jgi:ABC-type Zn uptake system ZnuABC Zn-binding protein ZnuA
MTVTLFRTIALAALLLAALPFAATAEEPVRAVATVSPLADIVRRIGGSHVVVSTVLSPGMYPSEFVPRENHLTKMRGTDLIIRIGEGGDPWSDRLVTAAGTNVKVINAARKEDLAIATRFTKLPEYNASGDTSVPMLFVWLDPRIVRERILPAVEQALIGLRPVHTEDFRRNSRRFFYELSKLEFESGAMLAQMPKKPFIAQSRAWNFFFNRYSLTPVAIIQTDEKMEVPAERIAKVVATAKTADVHLMFRDLRPPSRTAAQIANKLAARSVPLGVMGNEHHTTGNGYLELIRGNLKKLLLEFH